MILQMSILKRLICLCILVSLISTFSAFAEQGGLSKQVSKVLAVPWGNAEGEIGLKPGDVGGYWVVPVAFAVDAKTGDIFIVDEVNSRISKFNAAGKLIFSFSMGGKIKRFYCPMDIELDSQKHIIVFDNEKIQIFDAQGKILDVLQIPSTTGGPQENLFVDVNDNIYLRQPERILRFTKGQGQPIVYESQSLSQYGGALITSTGNILSFGGGLMTLSDGTHVIKQVRIEAGDTWRPYRHRIGIDREGNVYLYARPRGQSDQSKQKFAIQKMNADGKLIFSKELFDMKSVKYKGEFINSLIWKGQRMYVDWDGNVYFLKATSSGAEIWKLSTTQ